MAFPLRIAACLLLALFVTSGCRPFQSGSMSRLQQPLPTGDQMARGTGRTALRNSRESSSKQLSPPAIQQLADPSSQYQLSDSAGDHAANGAHAGQGADSEHNSQGYCASCGVTHGSSNGPPDFKFSEPLPQFQPVSQPRRSQPEPTGSSNQADAGSLPAAATYSSAVRVRPLQPEEARAAHKSTARPAPPPQPDDDPAPIAATGTTTPSETAAAVSPVTSATFVSSAIQSKPTLPSPSETPTNTEPRREGEQPDSTIKLAAESKTTAESTTGSDHSATVVLTSTAEAGADSIDCAATELVPAGLGAAAPLQLVELQQTLRSLRAQADLMASDLGTKLESELAALDLLAGRMEQLAAGEAEASEAQKACEHQIAALVATLRPDTLDISRPEGRTAAAATLDHLRAAISQLETLVSLKVTRGALCSEIRGFGQYKPFPTTELQAGQSVLLYCELENFCSAAKSEAGQSGYCTRLKSSLVICREDGSVAQQAEFPVVEDLARNRRRDFYLYVPFTVGELPVGTYTAHLLVDDLFGCKQAVLDPPVEFTVR